MHPILTIGLGGFAGAVARYYLQAWANLNFPSALVAVGTLSVNLLGCLIIGALAAWFQAKELAGSTAWFFFVTGILGSLTTFSTFGLETYSFFKSGMTINGLANIGAQVLLGLGMVWAGDKLMQAWL
ncbi:MAG: hypothetical protein A2508_10385 [Candidatus Lambdaproteobacteria bacterium RIFOXYD12_FULL_49_8]|uniref:Fluoride-specific ion channel FluC n=1 Tax=Candidatus Lambdaproteobacteria bacterium RIFOXYD2_FULL_50_16 TaxID=1817772 RepID=A0A1F6GB55_9PROT|nr:MAG: hypothetical protein A2527_07425 [Candidatus Lambdaproteobacteria bacterium RIFOXYD2_FULL_50_16]OGG97075.1 MAG: hypothetical protein A2508_10385 [Candidatus Lambdaproteobacteria bacterium RIFOXYD12_FULL_49_8]